MCVHSAASDKKVGDLECSIADLEREIERLRAAIEDDREAHRVEIEYLRGCHTQQLEELRVVTRCGQQFLT